MDMLKAFVLGTALTLVVAIVVGSQGSSGGALAVHSMALGNKEVFWSWPLFLTGTGLSWGILAMQR
ncbi:hypothetical protein [Erythrobacter rubeus]|uniref:Permease n=1 Tax=Erythrobacter rubeus TaxID=2760803 RepID=A0ABR8KYE3_9SPHN|nr:hypothetical protein [Erythrobacter rubeus]MBD2843181.1 hypothetical protein [Erythrobacter rubeus]